METHVCSSSSSCHFTWFVLLRLCWWFYTKTGKGITYHRRWNGKQRSHKCQMFFLVFLREVQVSSQWQILSFASLLSIVWIFCKTKIPFWNTFTIVDEELQSSDVTYKLREWSLVIHYSGPLSIFHLRVSRRVSITWSCISSIPFVFVAIC